MFEFNHVQPSNIVISTPQLMCDSECFVHEALSKPTVCRAWTSPTFRSYYSPQTGDNLSSYSDLHRTTYSIYWHSWEYSIYVHSYIYNDITIYVYIMIDITMYIYIYDDIYI